jgi:8-oxo-dGTP pyrophosphatase MutT (NUDIX family)
MRSLARRVPDRITWPPAPPSFRPAAVLIPIWEEEGEARTLLSVRSAQMRAHQGQVAFVGGRQDPTDTSLWHTALREAAEEAGIDPAGAEPLAQLDDVWSLHGYVVTPWVARLRSPPRLNPSDAEVARLIVTPLRTLLQDAPHEQEELGEGPFRYHMHAFEVQGERVWGMTGGIIHGWRTLLHGGTVATPSQGLHTLQLFLRHQRGELHE